MGMANARSDYVRTGKRKTAPPPATVQKEKDIKTLFINPVRFDTLKHDPNVEKTFDGVRVILNLAGTPGFVQSKFSDSDMRTLEGADQVFKQMSGLTYNGKSVAYTFLIRTIGLYTGVQEEKTLYAVDFMYL